MFPLEKVNPLGCVAALLMAVVSSSSWANSVCPDLRGHYRVDGFGPVLGDALEALELGMAGFSDSEVKITGNAAQSVELWVKSGETGVMASRPIRVLTHGVDYECSGGVLTLRREAEASRNVDGVYLEGESTVSLMRAGSGLRLAAAFVGGERATLYSYESARISVPKPWTGRALDAHIRWPRVTEPQPAIETREPQPASVQVVELRKQLDAVAGGAIRIGWLSGDGDRVRATLSASRSEDVVALEDRLRDQGLAYTVTRAPVWSNNEYSMEFQFGSQPRQAAGQWRPSVFRVAHELDSLRDPMISVRDVVEDGDGYVASLYVLRNAPVDRFVDRLRDTTIMFSEIRVLDDKVRAGEASPGLLRLWLRVP